ncbi:uncharacterized protein [Typha angustifolia]|uniref:uncharacterized protein n=1 Tax=Typha angustifolia TaxID=59011 RepID=UPI003C2D537C
MSIAMAANTALAVHHITDEATRSAGSSKSPDPPMSMLTWIGSKATGPIVFTCVCVALAYSWRKRRAAAQGTAAEKSMPLPRLQRSKSIAELHGGKLVLNKISEEKKAKQLNDEELKKAAEKMKELLGSRPLKFKELKEAATLLEMTGKEDEAIQMLREAWEKAKDEKLPHEAHELQMLLAEMLLYKGDYWQALECKCLDEKEFADARGPLIKAIVHYIKKDKGNAKECYKEFENIQLDFRFPDQFEKNEPVNNLVHGYNEFKSIVNRLDNEIKDARKPKA